MKYFSLWLLLLFNAAVTNGQSGTSTTVFASDSDAPLTGAAIIVEDNPKKGWVTDMNGRVSLDITQPTEVTVSFIGFLPKVITISPDEKATVILQEDALGLEEVVVTGSFKPTTVENSLYRVALVTRFNLTEVLMQDDFTMVKNPGKENMEIITKKGKEILCYKANSNAKSEGTAYELENGEIIYIPE